MLQRKRNGEPYFERIPHFMLLFRSLLGKAEGFQALVVADIPRNIIRANQLKVFLQVGTDGAVF